MRPKRSVGKVDYKDLADIKLPKRSRVTCRSKASLSASSDQSVLYRLKILERNEDRVKVRYIGYGSKYDEWRSSDEIVDLEEGDNNEAEVTRGEQLSPVAKLCLFKELACNIKLSLFSHTGREIQCVLLL